MRGFDEEGWVGGDVEAGFEDWSCKLVSARVRGHLIAEGKVSTDRLTVRPVVQPNTPHDRHVLRRQRAQELLDLVFFARGLREQRALAREHFDFEPAFLCESVDVGLVFGDDGLAVLDAAVCGRDVADEALPGGDGSHGGGGWGCEGAVLEGLPIGLWRGLEQLWSLGSSSVGAGSISSCQWQSLDSSDDMTFAGGSQREHVGLRKRKGRGKKGVSKQNVSLSYLQSDLTRACSAIVIVRTSQRRFHNRSLRVTMAGCCVPI